MKKLLGNTSSIWIHIAETTGKHYVYLSWLDADASFTLYGIGYKEYYEQLRLAAPIIFEKGTDGFELADYDWTIVECDTKEEAMEVYHSVVGDDGPTEVNSYDGPMCVYALTIHPDGLGCENT